MIKLLHGLVWKSFFTDRRYLIATHGKEDIYIDLHLPDVQLFKMEDVSMGLWVEQFTRTRQVQYIHNSKFCQFGCIDDYYTAHYQSPRLMLCMWQKLLDGKPQCCNVR